MFRCINKTPVLRQFGRSLLMVRQLSTHANNPFKGTMRTLQTPQGPKQYFSLEELADSRVARLPFSVRVLLECALRNCDEFQVTKKDVETIMDWAKTCKSFPDIPYKPARVIMQDMSGAPCLMDVASMRDAVKKLGGDPARVTPLVPVDLVIDHSVLADSAGRPDSMLINMKNEFKNNVERFRLMKWGSQAFPTLKVIPPGNGIIHQVNLEYLSRVVFDTNGLLHPDGVVGTDSHTTMCNGLGVFGWGVGGIEALSVMLGQPVVMQLPEVVGVRMTGALKPGVTATDLVLTVTQMLRKAGVVNKFVEFYGPGVQSLPLADRATVANMAPEYGATMGYFPIDSTTLKYIEQMGRPREKVALMEQYLKANMMWQDHSTEERTYSSKLNLDLSTVQPSVAGPKRPQDKVFVKDVKKDFTACLTNKVGFKGYGLKPEAKGKAVDVTLENGKSCTVKNGSVLIASITSCTNTSNPSLMLTAGLIAKRAVELGLEVPAYVKTSLSPGSRVVAEYLKAAGLQDSLDKLGFQVIGFGCMTCVGNSGELDANLSKAVADNGLVTCASVSSNRNFEARVHPLIRANFLCSPPLVMLYALAGKMDIDFEKEPVGVSKTGTPVFLKDLWPSTQEVADLAAAALKPELFQSIYHDGKGGITQGNEDWEALEVPRTQLYEWDSKSTYINLPPFLVKAGREPPSFDKQRHITNAQCLLLLGDSITTDHISPVSRIDAKSCAGRYMQGLGIKKSEFGTYGTRRGNAEVMMRGTFANPRLPNIMMKGKVGPQTVHVPSGKTMDIYDAAMKYVQADVPTIIIAGTEYGTGSARDWAAKGTALLGVRVVLAKSFERIHRSNLVGMGVVPLAFKNGEDAKTYGLTGSEKFTIVLPETMQPGQDIKVQVERADKSTFDFTVKLRLDTTIEIAYFKHGGIMPFVMRQLL